MDTIAKAKQDYGINSMLEQIAYIEIRFHKALNRTRRYYSKDQKTGTILTLLGEITFERTYYQDRNSRNYFFYVDFCLKLEKYRTIDPYLESMLLDECSKISMSVLLEILLS